MTSFGSLAALGGATETGYFATVTSLAAMS